MKAWKEPEGWLLSPEEMSEDPGPKAEESTQRGRVKIRDSLTVEQQKELGWFIAKFSNVFSKVPSKARGVVHEINMPKGADMREKWRPVPHHPQVWVYEEIQKMLRQGVTVASQTPWRSPMVVVLKFDGSLRMCVDFRGLNMVALFNAFPMPDVEELLEQIDQAKYISTLDLSKGY